MSDLEHKRGREGRMGSALAGLLAASALVAGGTATAGVPDAPKNWEKCAGVAQAGHNDCGSLDGAHSCGGKSKIDDDPNEWLYVPEGTCTKIGGQVIGTKPAK